MVSKTLFHGSAQLFERFDQSKARIPNDLWGGGTAYFTTMEAIAEGYAKAMFRKSKEKNIENSLEIVYQVSLSIRKLFDVENTFTGKELTQFYKRSDQEQFARGAGLLTYGVDKYDVLVKLDAGRMLLTGDQIFKGLSGGMIRTAQAREKLRSLGYTTLKYIGGQFSGVPRHDVYIAYDANDIRIHSYKIGKPLNQSGFK